MDSRESCPDPDSPTLESRFVRRAVDGDPEAIHWCIEKYSPWLAALAERRMPASLQAKYSPADLVQDTWLTVLPKLSSIEERGGRKTPVLMKFLMTTQMNLQNALFRKHIRGKPLQVGSGPESRTGLLSQLPASMIGPVTHLVREDRLAATRDELGRALEALGEADRELVLQRMQGLRYQEIAESLGGNPNQLAVRFHRAIQKLRAEIDDELLADFVDPE